MRNKLLAGVSAPALGLLIAMLAPSSPMSAQTVQGGGNGGAAKTTGGSGGDNQTTGSGNAGTDVIDIFGGGGGGGGGAGETGGQGGEGAEWTIGGAGGAGPGLDGNNGRAAVDAGGVGGGGGGGGAHGTVVSTLPVGASTGGTGGNGGAGLSDARSGGGGGGAGGYGAVVTNSNLSGNISSGITGGNGGNGGSAAFAGHGGNGGGGGIGVSFTGNASDVTVQSGITIRGGDGGSGGNIVAGGGGTGGWGGTGGAGLTGTNIELTIDGAVNGGTGGARGVGPTNGVGGAGGAGIAGTGLILNIAGSVTGGNGGYDASGGVGIVGSGLSIIGTGTISGGWNGSSTVRANAIELSGSNNRLEIRDTSTITGNVVVAGGGSSNVLALGGAVSTSFDAGQIGTTQQYQGFTAFEKSGASTWTLTGTNTFSGTTTVTGGMLKAGNAGAFSASSAHTVASGATLDLGDYNQTIGSLAGAGKVMLDSATLTTGGDNQTTAFSGSIEGSGALVKVGTGFFGLTNANMSWSGGATAQQGVLGVGHNAALGSGALTLDGGVLQAWDAGLALSNAVIATSNDGGIDNAGRVLTLNGPISGAGAIRFTDAGDSGSPGVTGRTVLNGDNSAWTGGAEIMDAAVAVAHNNALGTGVVELNDGGLIAGAADLTLANTITLHAVPGGNVIDNGGHRFTLAGPITNETPGAPGTVVFGGFGSTVLTGISSYTGFTRVHSGTLSVNGSIASSSLTTVNTGGTLGGNGIVGNTTIDGGTLSPGNSIGLLTVQGNLVFTAASSYMVEVSPSNADRTNVTGTATLGGAAVKVSFAPGTYVAKQYTIVNAVGGVSGTFAGPVNTNLPANFTSSLSYDADNAFLDLRLNYMPAAPNFDNGLSGNQQAIATTLINFFNSTGSIPLAFGALSPQGLSQASGELAAGTQQSTFGAMSQFMDVMTDPSMAGRDAAAPSGGAASFAAENDEALGYTANGKARTAAEREAYATMSRKALPMAPTFEQRWSVWAAGFGGSQTISGNNAVGSSTATSNLYGIAVGADYRISPDTLVGFAMVGGGTNFQVANGLGSGRSDLFQAGAFIRHHIGNAYLSGALAYGWQDVSTERTVTAAGIERLHASFNANTISGRLEAGYRINTALAGITPYAAGQVTTYALPAYAEHASAGSLFALNYAAKDITSPRSELGLRTDKSFGLQDAVLTLRSRAAWAHNFDTDRAITATFRSLPGASFLVNGAQQAREAALVTGSAEMKCANGFAIAATFEGEFSDTTESYAGKGVVRYSW